MRLNRLDLNLLVALDALLTEQSITRAAEKIHVSQPAASGSLARLREFFGDELLVRVGAQMKPTPLGESLAAPVHNILLQIQATVDRGLEFVPEESQRRFRIQLSDLSTGSLMSALVQHLSVVAPKVQLELINPTNYPAEELERGEIDFLIMPTQFLSESHPQCDMAKEGFVCLLSADHPTIGDSISVEEFMQLGHVTVKFGSGRRDSQDQMSLAGQYGLKPNVELITSSFNSIPPLLVGTPRVATVYESLAKTWASMLPLKILPMPLELPEVTWGLQWHKFRDLDPGVQWLRSQVVTVAKNLAS
jgi:DNA-binding transcriptional LysR family regulator